jgi:hypothetical protein
MLVSNFSLLNREYNLMNVLKALASIISTCNFRAILLLRLNLDILHCLQMECHIHSA